MDIGKLKNKELIEDLLESLNKYEKKESSFITHVSINGDLYYTPNFEYLDPWDLSKKGEK